MGLVMFAIFFIFHLQPAVLSMKEQGSHSLYCSPLLSSKEIPTVRTVLCVQGVLGKELPATSLSIFGISYTGSTKQGCHAGNKARRSSQRYYLSPHLWHMQDLCLIVDL